MMTEVPPPPPKKRSKLLRVVMALGLVVLIGAIWVVVSVLIAKPSEDPTVHAKALELAQRGQPDPDQPSRYPQLIEALAELDEQIDILADEIISDERYQQTQSRSLNFYAIAAEPDPDDIDAEKIALQAIDARRAAELVLERALLDDFLASLEAPNLANGYPTAYDDDGDLVPMFGWTLGELGQFREHTMTVVATSRVLAERGETERAASLLEDIAPLPGILTRHITLIEHLVGYAVSAVIAEEIAHLATRPDLTPQALATLRRAQAELADLGSLETAIEGEALFMRDFHFRTHTAGGRYIPSAGETIMESYEPDAPDGGFTPQLSDVTGYLAVRRDTSLAKADEYYARIRAAINESDPETQASILEAMEQDVQDLSPRYAVIRLAMPAVARVVQNTSKYRAQTIALDVLLAMAAHRLDTGNWPDSIQALIPAYVDEHPTDPVTGQPLEYRHEPGTPPTLESFGSENNSGR
ncbi:hypothetical protein ABWH91_02490 [Phycisphaerales bacterium ac7]